MAAEAGVAQRIRAHHGAMTKALGRLVAAVAQAPDAAALAGALGALDQYWRSEVLPHAAAEESTIYAAAASPETRLLVRALEAEHRVLEERGQAMGRLRARAAAGPVAGQPGLADALGTEAAMAAASAAALFASHAAAESDFLLPALLQAGIALGPVLTRMEHAFSAARRRAQGGAVAS